MASALLSGSQNPEVPNSAKRPGSKKGQLTCEREMRSSALLLIPQLFLKSRVVLQGQKPHAFSLLD